ncbi:MAG: beta-ketoacyl synthase N-terminal-like domain-containing protein [Elainellaceae cyanobacterium]
MIDPTASRLSRMAIVGMDAALSTCDGLDAVERSIYDSTQHIPDSSHSSARSPGADDLQSLTLKIADRAIQAARLKPGDNVAVISVTPANAQPHLVSINPASHICDRWQFTSKAMRMDAESCSLSAGLAIAQRLLETGEADAVLVSASNATADSIHALVESKPINTGTKTLGFDRHATGWTPRDGLGTVVLKRLDHAKRDQNIIYAVIDALCWTPVDASATGSSEEIHSTNNQGLSAEAIAHTCQSACHQAGINPSHVGYLEVSGSGIPDDDEREINGLLQAYRGASPDLTCAIGSIKANVGHTQAASGIASLIKTALCLYHRYIPGIPGWSGPKQPDLWRNSPFYGATESRPWFLDQKASSRIAALSDIGLDGTYAHLILSEEPEQHDRSSRYLQDMPLQLFPIAGGDRTALLNQLDELEQTIADCPSILTAARQTFATYQGHADAPYTLVILGRKADEIHREIQRARQGIVKAFEHQDDWQTPVGSYFTVNPLGRRGGVAYVYPGAFSAYVGLGRTLFRLFPNVWDELIFKTVGECVDHVEKFVYPRRLNALSLRQKEALEKELLSDPLAMLEAEMAYAGIVTAVLKNDFKLQSDFVFGYCLGEISMMVAQGIWADFDQAVGMFNTSPLFGNRLSGSMKALQEYWHLSSGTGHADAWSIYVVMAPASQVSACIAQEKRVFLTQINTPREVVIAGHPESCQRVIDSLKCSAFRAPFSYLMHCPPMHSEYDEIVRLNTLPVHHVPARTFYSAANYQPMALDSDSIGHCVAKTLCQPFDLPRLVNRVYDDGARIFIEAGAGSTCTRWISETLKSQDHVAVSFNRRGMDEHTAILRMMATLVSHRVPLDLSSLYSEATRPSHHEVSDFKSAPQPANETKRAIAPSNSASPNPSALYHPSTSQQRFSNLHHHYHHLSENNSRVIRTHRALLDIRQESLRQMSEIVQSQISFSRRLLSQDSAQPRRPSR